MAKLEKTRTKNARPYLLRGLMRCGLCERKMQGAAIRHGTYYRCMARTLTPNSPVLAEHPKTVNLREDTVIEALNGWICRTFGPEHRDETVAAMVASQTTHSDGAAVSREAAKKRLANAEARVRRHQDAIDAGVDAAALAEVINEAQAERAAAKAALNTVHGAETVTAAEVYAMIDSLGDIAAVMTEQRPPSLGRLYEKLKPTLRYEPEEHALYIKASPRVVSECVRRAHRALFTRRWF